MRRSMGLFSRFAASGAPALDVTGAFLTVRS
jgi:hypothetical protein